jgi:hypothetical protein
VGSVVCGSKENHLTVPGYRWPHVTGRRPELSRRAVNFDGKREESDEDGLRSLRVEQPTPCLALRLSKQKKLSQDILNDVQRSPIRKERGFRLGERQEME